MMSYHGQSKSQKECAILMLQRLEEFLTKQKRYVGWIHESIEFLYLVYRKRKFAKIDQLTYKVKRETLLSLFDSIEELYTDYRDVLLKFPDELGRDTIQEAWEVLERAQSILKVCHAVPILNTVPQVERVVKIKVPIVKVAHFETIEKHFNVLVKEPLKLFVVPKSNLLKSPKVVNFSSHQIQSVECKVEKLCRVFIKEKARTFVKINRDNVLSVFNETFIKPSVNMFSSKPIRIMDEVVTSVKESCYCELLNVADGYEGYESFRQVMNTSIIESGVIEVSKLNISFFCLKFYDRVSLRMFWFYFLFADFSFVVFFVCLGSSFMFFILFLFVGQVSLFVVKIGILTVGSVNAVLALILCLFLCVIV